MYTATEYYRFLTNRRYYSASAKYTTEVEYIAQLLDEWQARQPRAIPVVLYYYAFHYAITVLYKDPEFGSTTEINKAMHQLNECLGTIAKSYMKTTESLRREDEPIKHDLNRVPTHLPCRGPYESPSSYAERLARARTIAALYDG